MSREASGDDAVAALTPLRECVARHAEALAAVMGAGDIAVCVLDPSDSWCDVLEIKRGTKEAALKMPPAMRKGFINHGDSVTARWCKGGRTGRLFAIWEDSTLLLNVQDGVISPEPGSMDSEVH